MTFGTDEYPTDGDGRRLRAPPPEESGNGKTMLEESSWFVNDVRPGEGAARAVTYVSEEEAGALAS